MSVLNDIRAALESDLVNVTDIPALANWEVENGPRYVPTEGVPWVRVQCARTSRRPATRGTNPTFRHEGIFTVTIMWPKGLGAGDAETLADSIVSRYDVGDVKTSGGVPVRFDYSETGDADGESDPAWYILPVTAAWYSYQAT